MENVGLIEIMERGDAVDARSKLLAAALEEFATRSLDAARTREIAKKAGVNHAAICYYFGGKKELYLEVVRQMTELCKHHNKPYMDRALVVCRTRDADEAKKLIYDIEMSRVFVEDKNSEILKFMVMFLNREEQTVSIGFDMFYENAIKPVADIMHTLVEIASHGAFFGARAKIVAAMIMGQIHIFSSIRTGIKRINGWKTFTNAERDLVGEMLSALLDRIFKTK